MSRGLKAFDMTRENYDLRELFADEFACALMMPPEDFTACVNRGFTDVMLAERYAMPRDVVAAWRERLEVHPFDGRPIDRAPGKTQMQINVAKRNDPHFVEKKPTPLLRRVLDALFD